jgi:hypothetical protein
MHHRRSRPTRFSGKPSHLSDRKGPAENLRACGVWM